MMDAVKAAIYNNSDAKGLAGITVFWILDSYT
jgi:hypothetical protein